MGTNLSERLKWARFYAEECGFSVIPVRPDKKPYIKWQEYQKRRATIEEIEEWWERWPDAMIGIVTGRISNLFVIDCDSRDGYDRIAEHLSDSLTMPVLKTPRGGRHLYFTFEDLDLSVGTRVVPDVDYRGEGGYVIAPPSVNENGGKYVWFKDRSIQDHDPPALPDSLKNLFIKTYRDNASSHAESATDGHNMFQDGRRDNDLFHVAYQLAKSGTPKSEITQVLELLAKSCNPPFPEREIAAKVESAMKRAEQRERSIAQEVRDWVMTTEGHFTTTDCHTELQLATAQQRRNANEVLRRLRDEGVIESFGSKNGCYRKVVVEYETMDYANASTEEFDVTLPISIHDLCKIYPGNVIVVAGAKSAGKTAFLLNVIRDNMDRHKIVYLNSEMGESELRIRLGLFRDTQIEQWNFTPIIRGSNWADLIDGTRKIWIIDYMEMPSDKLHLVADEIRAIHRKLKDGICIVALQKPQGRDTGRGDTFSMEKARLYLALDTGRIKIVDAKAWRNASKNSKGKVKRFKIDNGSIITPLGNWSDDEEKGKKFDKK